MTTATAKRPRVRTGRHTARTSGAWASEETKSRQRFVAAAKRFKPELVAERMRAWAGSRIADFALFTLRDLEDMSEEQRLEVVEEIRDVLRKAGVQ
ncbi:hypothetical protein MX572_22980 (plasmid) [Rhodococcus pyridinivorans]|uniref:hypothetical protein n=1 Tax=Rhodococcus pyridinivorans TaxID=103816 RepID=UPI0020C65743|nr:hypothetical protein [Rhodococcus pyridinivorans]UTM39664.1 hypothetical protein MX572_23035 [Rhodococcus pyridinivorans]UTM39676.1 hypothetical protein MX572_22980 [Rhodococcus pyridinivorans]